MAIFNATATRSRSSRAFKQFATHNKAMYFGKMDQYKSDYHLVRGFTASHQHKDLDHCVGTFSNHDFVLLRRTNTLGTMLICEVDLHTLYPFSHFFILPNSLAKPQFDTLITHYPTYRHAPYAPRDSFSAHFKHTYAVFAKPTYFERALYFADQSVAEFIDTNSQHYTYEVIDNSLFVYCFEPQSITEKSLDTFVRFSCSLASQLETKHRK